MATPCLSSRERVRLALDHRATDRIPFAMVCSGINRPARVALEEFLRRTRGCGVDERLAALLDIRAVGAPYTGPRLPPGRDHWGVVREAVSYGPDAYQEISFHPLGAMTCVAEIDAYDWPRHAAFDYGAVTVQVRRHLAEGPFSVMIANANPFETAWYMRGFERLLMDFVEAPDLAHAILRHATHFHCEHFRRMLSAGEGGIDLAFTADDIGGQNGLLMSLDMWAEFIKPCHERINRIVHDAGARVIYHSDGAVMDAVPGLMDMGIDILQALQFDAAGMDPVRLKDDYGDRLCFQGGVSVQHTLPFGTAAEVAEEVRQRIAVLGDGGGYIPGPSHVIQAGTPPENIAAMLDVVETYYPFA